MGNSTANRGSNGSFGGWLKEKRLQIILHQFRHTFATMMLECGANPWVVQEFLGHKDISATLGIYAGVTSDVKAAADEVILRPIFLANMVKYLYPGLGKDDCFLPHKLCEP